MSGEIEPIQGEVVEPTAVYGPDDWRPYADNPAPEISIDSQRVIHNILDDLLYAAGSRTTHHTYDPNGAAEYTDPLNVRERNRTPEAFLTPALLEAQRRLRERVEFSMQFRDPNAIIKITGTGM